MSVEKRIFRSWSVLAHEKLDRMGDSGLKYPEYQLLEAYLYHLENEDEKAVRLS